MNKSFLKNVTALELSFPLALFLHMQTTTFIYIFLKSQFVFPLYMLLFKVICPMCVLSIYIFDLRTELQHFHNPEPAQLCCKEMIAGGVQVLTLLALVTAVMSECRSEECG